MTTNEPSRRPARDSAGAADTAEPQPRRTFLLGAGSVLAGSLLGVDRSGRDTQQDWERPRPHAPAPAASPSSGLSRKGLGRGVVTRGGPIEVERGTDVVVDSVAMAPGGTTGWHTHPGPEIVLVTRGTLTFRRSDGVRCVTEEVSSGQAFLGAAAGELHAAHNAGSEPVEFLATFFNVPNGGPPRTDAHPPLSCG